MRIVKELKEIEKIQDEIANLNKIKNKYGQGDTKPVQDFLVNLQKETLDSFSMNRIPFQKSNYYRNDRYPITDHYIPG